MNHANKMILVPHDIVGDDEGKTKYMSNLDEEMFKILNDMSLPIDEKLLKYNQVLRRHQTAKQDINKPFQFEMQESQTHATDKPEQPDSVQEAITETVPPKFQKQANVLLKYARKIPHIKWADNGEMIVDGNKIAGSNIVDIINDLARERKPQPALGSDVFLKKLIEANVPKEIILNKKRLSLLNQDVYASPEAKLPVEEKSPATPSSKRTRAENLPHNGTGLNLR